MYTYSRYLLYHYHRIQKLVMKNHINYKFFRTSISLSVVKQNDQIRWYKHNQYGSIVMIVIKKCNVLIVFQSIVLLVIRIQCECIAIFYFRHH